MPTYTHSNRGVKCGHCSSRLRRPIYHPSTTDVLSCSPFVANQGGSRQYYRNERANIFTPAVDDLLTRMLLDTRDGRYAVKLDQSDPFRFIRISRPKNGKSAGYLKIQSQHAESLAPVASLRLDLDPRKRYLQNASYIPYLRMLVCDSTTAAMDYGRTLQRCSRCGIQLTDDRSRWFAIGPECEKYWPDIIGMVLDKKGPYVPGWES